MKQMRGSAARRLAVVPLALALAAAACGKSSSPGSTGASPSAAALSGTLNGSGSTFQLPFDEEAISSFTQDKQGVTINYAGGGSGKGRTDLQNKLVDWAGSDATIKPEELPKYP